MAVELVLRAAKPPLNTSRACEGLVRGTRITFSRKKEASSSRMRSAVAAAEGASRSYTVSL